jgi:D-xylonolactonase
MNTQPELAVDCPCHLGESPLWHPIERKLYWLDIDRGLIFSFDPETGEQQTCYRGEPVGGMTVQKDGSLLLFMAGGLIASWRGGRLEVITEVSEEREHRFNDCIADPMGRVLCGTLSATPHRIGRLYRLDTDGSITRLRDEVRGSNGMGFTPDGRQLYHSETRAWRINLFDYDLSTGTISNRRNFVTIAEESRPDGLTVDAEGHVWSARYDGGAVFRYRPDGTEDTRIPMPAPKVTSLAFGGEGLGDLYVTSAGGQDRSAENPLAGSLFRLRPGVRGVPEFFSSVAL